MRRDATLLKFPSAAACDSGHKAGRSEGIASEFLAIAVTGSG